MVRIIAALLGGLLAGIAITYVALNAGSGSHEREAVADVVRDIGDAPKMSAAAATEHRDKQYAELTTIEEIHALPTSFARAEALYLLAGRSESGEVQALIFEANRIANEIERYTTLQILFHRLAEMDPESALALSRTEFFRGVRLFEQTVWQAWGRMDLDEALFAAKTQSSASDQSMAAQSLFAAFGFMGNETTDRIESELGIKPDRSTRGRFLYLMIDRSPAEAVAHINAMPRGSQRGEYIWWLAHYLSQRGTDVALAYADLFHNAAEAKSYRDMVRGQAARDNPTAAIDEILASGQLMRRGSELHVAMDALAREDIERAKQYFDDARSVEQKQTIGSIIVRAMVDQDPDEALRWARANSVGQLQHMEFEVLARIAETDPERALNEAQTTSNSRLRAELISTVITQLVQSDPERAIGYLDLIDNEDVRERATAEVAINWMQRDPDSALNWVLRNDEKTAARLLGQTSWALIQNDIDAAIQVLPRLDGELQQHWRAQIAEQLFQTRSLADAQAFVQRFEGEPGYEQLQAQFISSLAQTDSVQARQLADQLSDPRARDTAYSRIISVQAHRDPQAAAAMLSSLSDESYRGMAAAQVAGAWYGIDPPAAMRWVSRLPTGAARDDVILTLASNWAAATAEQTALINSIGSDDKRGQAKVRQVWSLMRTDPIRARELLEDPDIPDYRRQQIESMLQRGGQGF